MTVIMGLSLVAGAILIGIVGGLSIALVWYSKIVRYVVIAIAISVYGTALKGWAMVTLWAWFVIPTFGLPALTMPVAIGLGFLLHLFQYIDFNSIEQHQDKEPDLLLKSVKTFMFATLFPLFSVGCGWLVKLFI